MLWLVEGEATVWRAGTVGPLGGRHAATYPLNGLLKTRVPERARGTGSAGSRGGHEGGVRVAAGVGVAGVGVTGVGAAGGGWGGVAGQHDQRRRAQPCLTVGLQGARGHAGLPLMQGRARARAAGRARAETTLTRVHTVSPTIYTTHTTPTPATITGAPS